MFEAKCQRENSCRLLWANIPRTHAYVLPPLSFWKCTFNAITTENKFMQIAGRERRMKKFRGIQVTENGRAHSADAAIRPKTKTLIHFPMAINIQIPSERLSHLLVSLSAEKMADDFLFLVAGSFFPLCPPPSERDDLDNFFEKCTVCAIGDIRNYFSENRSKYKLICH